MKCSKCPKKLEVGDNTTSVLCSNCTLKDCEKWIIQLKKEVKYYEEEKEK